MKKKSVLLIVCLLLLSVLLTACDSTYHCGDNGAKLVVTNDGYSVKVTTSDGELYESDVYGYGYILTNYVELGGEEYIIRMGDTQKYVSLTTKGQDAPGLAGVYKK